MAVSARALLALAALISAQPALAQVRPLARPASLAIPADPLVPAAPEAPAALAPGDALDALAAPTAEPEPAVGPETGLPLPRFVSLKSGEGNARRGPSLEHRIDWVFLREDMPLLITAEYENWRRVEDRDGMGGWVHYSLLSGTRSAIVDQHMVTLRVRPDAGATEVAAVEAGVVARLDACEALWCRIDAGGLRGWVPKSALWGVGPDEVLD